VQMSIILLPMQPLWPDTPPFDSPDSDFIPYIESYPVDTPEQRGAVVVLPGGGYAGRAPHEAAPIAERIVESGFNAFVVHYRVAPNRYPAPLADATRAMRIVRNDAANLNIDPDKIAILGFSAGGHLAASVGVYHSEAKGIGDQIDNVSGRPDALVLCYPVITSGAHRHSGSMANLYGPDATADEIDHFSLERAVTKDTPPTYLWHTAADAGVPVQNSLLFAEALQQHQVPFELHVFPYGAHGLGLAPEDAHVARWFGLCAEWLEALGF
jgi:acetyl esterase/lipase